MSREAGGLRVEISVCVWRGAWGKWQLAHCPSYCESGDEIGLQINEAFFFFLQSASGIGLTVSPPSSTLGCHPRPQGGGRQGGRTRAHPHGVSIGKGGWTPWEG